MSLSGHRLVVHNEGVRGGFSSLPTNYIDYGSKWANNIAGFYYGRDSEQHERCMEGTLGACMRLALNWTQEDEDEEAEDFSTRRFPDTGVSVHFHGTAVEVQVRVDFIPGEDCKSSSQADALELSLGYSPFLNDESLGTFMRFTPSPDGDLDTFLPFPSSSVNLLRDRAHVFTVYPYADRRACPPEDYTLYVDYAVVTPSQESPIDVERDLLAVSTGDQGGWIQFDGAGWEGSKLEEREYYALALGGERMSTSVEGDEVVFTFLGTSARIYGVVTNLQAVLLVSIDDAPSEEHPLNLLSGPQRVWESDSLYEISGLDPSRAHTIRLSAKDFTNPSDTFASQLVVFGFAYRPSFTSLAEGQSMWIEMNGGESQETMLNPVPSGTPEEDTSAGATGEGGQPNNVGAIAGGVVGGMAFIGLAGLIFWFLLRRRREQARYPLITGEGYSTAAKPYITSEVDDSPTSPHGPRPLTISIPSYHKSSEARSGSANSSGPNELVFDITSAATEGSSRGSTTSLPGAGPGRRDTLRSQSSRRGAGAAEELGPVAEESEGLRHVVQSLVDRVNAIEQPPPYADHHHGTGRNAHNA